MVEALTIDLPEAVRAKAGALGAAGADWVRELPSVVASLAADWRLSSIGSPLAGGSAGFLAFVESDQHGPAVLKVRIPDGLEGNGTFAAELAALDAGRHVRVLERDHARRAMLQERLGRPLSALGYGVEQQLEVMARTVAAAWYVPAPEVAARFRTGAEKAALLAAFIEDWWERTGRPCSERAVGVALQRCERRRSGFDPATAVFVHGDAHAGNVVEAADGSPGDGFVLVDPEGLISEPAHDVGLALRGYVGEPAQLRAWCDLVCTAAGGVDAEVAWEWAFIEQVSTGLYLTQLGLLEEGRQFLALADELAAEAPPRR